MNFVLEVAYFIEQEMGEMIGEIDDIVKLGLDI